MNRSEICKIVLEIVSEVCDITIESIISESRKSDIVDARCLAVKILYDLGVSRDSIIKIIHRKHHYSVNQLLDAYDSRKHNAYFRWCDNEVKRIFRERMPP